MGNIILKNKTTAKKILTLIIFTAIIFGIFTVFPTTTVLAAPAGPGIYKVTTTAGLNVRSGPNAGYNRISGINYGATFTVTQTSNEWGYVPSYGGWVSLDYAQLIQATPAPTPESIKSPGIYKVTTAAGLNVRLGIGTNYNITGGIPYGYTFTVEQVSNGWGYVSSYRGWVCLDYAQYIQALPTPVPTPTPAPANSNVTSKLDALINGTAPLRYNGSTQYAAAGTKWNDWQSSVWGWQCKGFATAVFYELYGYNIAACYFGARRHVLDISTTKTIEVFSEYRSTKDRMITLLKNTSPGDYIQIAKSTSQHSMIVYSVESNGIWVYDANTDNNNTIKKQFRDWNYFYDYMGSSSYGISAYRAK